MIRRALITVAVSVGVALGVLLSGEVLVRVAGIEAMEWRATDRPLPGVQTDPLLGPLLRAGWSGRWLEGFTVVADGRGFRGTGLESPAAPRARVAFIGDSCTFGWGMDTPDTFVAQLDARQRALGGPRLDLLNAGYPGQSAVVGLHVLRERVLPLRPDVVVIGFSANNAFRFSLASDADRLHHFAVRKLLLRARLVRIITTWLSNHAAPVPNPRARDVVSRTPLAALKRVASAEEFEASMRAIVAESRASDTRPMLLVFPRAAIVSSQYQYEDAAAVARHLPADGRRDGGIPSPQELNALEASCLDHRAADDPVGALYARGPGWRMVYPADPGVRRALQAGARAYVDGHYRDAAAHIDEALARQPDSPLALYDRGVTRVALHDLGGLEDLAAADRLACSVFLEHQVILRRLAVDLNVPVVDLTMVFQAHDGEPLFLDPAHPNRAGHRLIADALSPAIAALIGMRP